MRFLRRDDLAEKSLPTSKSVINRWIRQGRFPRPDKYFGKTPVWAEATIDNWIENLPAGQWSNNAA